MQLYNVPTIYFKNVGYTIFSHLLKPMLMMYQNIPVLDAIPSMGNITSPSLFSIFTWQEGLSSISRHRDENGCILFTISAWATGIPHLGILSPLPIPTPFPIVGFWFPASSLRYSSLSWHVIPWWEFGSLGRCSLLLNGDRRHFWLGCVTLLEHVFSSVITSPFSYFPYL